MRLTRIQLRKLIREMSFGGNLGGVTNDGFSDRADLVYNGSMSRKEWLEIQKKAALAYAKSKAFDAEAEKRFRHVDSNIYTIYNIGSIYELRNEGGLDDLQLSGGEGSRPDSDLAGVGASNHRTRVVDIGTGLEIIKRHSKLANLDTSGIDAKDVVIFYSASIIGNKGDWQKASPWTIFHAIFEQNVEESEYYDIDLQKLSPTYFKLLEYLEQNYGGKFGLKNIGQVLTMGAARKGYFDRVDGNGINGDNAAEMLCQEILTRRGLVLNLSKAAPEDIDGWKELESIIKESAKEVRKNIVGKFIFVGVN